MELIILLFLFLFATLYYLKKGDSLYKFVIDGANVVYDNWLAPAARITGKGNKYYRSPTINKHVFNTTVANDILSELQMNNQGEMPPDVMKDLTTAGGIDMYTDDIDESGAAQYRTFESPEEKFNNIIDMGNPLKDIRSRYRR